MYAGAHQKAYNSNATQPGSSETGLVRKDALCAGDLLTRAQHRLGLEVRVDRIRRHAALVVLVAGHE